MSNLPFTLRQKPPSSSSSSSRRNRSSSSSQQTPTLPSPAPAVQNQTSELPKSRKEKNRAHAKNYKDRVKNKEIWDLNQAFEITDNIEKLERKLTKVQREANSQPHHGGSSSTQSPNERRPDWFGDPF